MIKCWVMWFFLFYEYLYQPSVFQGYEAAEQSPAPEGENDNVFVIVLFLLLLIKMNIWMNYTSKRNLIYITQYSTNFSNSIFRKKNIQWSYIWTACFQFSGRIPSYCINLLKHSCWKISKVLLSMNTFIQKVCRSHYTDCNMYNFIL